MTAHETLNILLVDDEEIVHRTLAPYLRDSGHSVEGTGDGPSALELIKENDYDLALVDVRMPGIDGLSVLAKVQELRPELSVVIITGHGNMELAIQALRLGAADFLTKPVKLTELDAIIEKSSRIRELRKNQRRLRETIGEIQALEDDRERGRCLVAESPAMREVKEKVALAVESNLETILISGETGTGKEVVAREIHFLDNKSDQIPFIAVSCPALPENLVESELFGHVKGAFTGATVDKAGCFELADEGSLFLEDGTKSRGLERSRRQCQGNSRHQQEVGGAGGIRGFPPGPLLSAQRLHGRAEASSGAQRGHHTPGRAFPFIVRGRQGL
jgi:two-component system nitrogen regulation response regulator GlnG